MSRRAVAELFFFASTFIWAGTFSAIKWGLEDLSPLLLVALRFTLSALLFGSIFLKYLIRIDRKVFLESGILGGLLFLAFASQTAGLQYTTTSKSAFITAMMVLFTPLFQFFIERKRPTPANLLGVGIVTVGLWLLTSPAGGGFNRGDALTLLCASSFGLYIVMMDIISRRHDTLHLTFLQIAFCAAFTWLCVPWAETSHWRLSAGALWALAYLAIPATLLTTYIYTRYQRDTTPTRAAVIFTLEPVWAAILGFLFFQEVLGVPGLLGAALIVAGILVSEASKS